MRHRGRLLFGIGARLLGSEPEHVLQAGEYWSLVDAARHCSDAGSRDALLAATQAIQLPRRIPRALRPLTVLTAVASASLRDPGSGLARGMAAVHHRVTGRFAT